MYVELITILVRAKDDITRACRRCQSTLYIVFNIAKVGGPHYSPSALLQMDFKSSASILYDYDVSNCLLSTIDSYNVISGNLSITVSGKNAVRTVPHSEFICVPVCFDFYPPSFEKYDRDHPHSSLTLGQTCFTTDGRVSL